MPFIAQVVVDIASSNTDRVFDYILPEAYAHVQLGTRVQVQFGPRLVEGYIVAFAQESAVPLAQLKPIHSVLEEEPSILPELLALAHTLAQQYKCPLAYTLRLMYPAQMRKGRIKEKKEKAVVLLLNPVGAEKAMASLPTNARNQKAILLQLVQAPVLSLRGLNQLVPNATASLAPLQAKGWVDVVEREVFRNPYSGIAAALENPGVQLTQMQQQAIDILQDAFSAGGRFLIHGVTGSGKTEIYFHAISQVLKHGKTAILLVPEISLTPQMVELFRKRFGKTVAVLHSRLSAGERYDEWRRLRFGDAQVAIGARSAIFAPLKNVGIVIVDEEHESSYVSEHPPMYDAVEVAKLRCQNGATLILGSATPSVARYHQATQGEYRIITLPERATGAQLPPVEVVDMRSELAQGNRSMLSGTLHAALQNCFDAGEQAMLLINRRGFLTHVSCRDCGYVVKCGNCEVAMTYHMAENRMRCHYCDETHALPLVCPQCNSKRIRYFGIGTEKVEQEIARLFPQARILRMDADTTRGKDAHVKILQAFRDGQADLLIGTQMIAKGHDFPNVTLAAVLAVDTTLYQPDYKSREKAFGLIAQMAGRSGRNKPGQVVVQTYSPTHFAVQCGSKHDYLGFFNQEIELRMQEGYPPFTQFLRFLSQGEDLQQTKDLSARLHAEVLHALEQNGFVGITVTQGPAGLERLKGKYRFQVLVKAANDANAPDAFDKIYSAAQHLLDARTQVQINPYQID